MKIVLINPPHTAIGSRIPNEHLPPLGLLSVAGPLLDAGFSVELIDAELAPMSLPEIVQAVRDTQPDVVMMGHSGSSSANTTVIELCRVLKLSMGHLQIVYGGVHPTYHWDEILNDCPAIDFIVRGEGEQTALNLMQALAQNAPIDTVDGIAYRSGGRSVCTPPAPMIRKLSAYRVAWELIDLSKYSYWGGKRAVVVQFSRGCPHLCNYCGQRGFWTQWRHRDPVTFARELAQLHREHGVELINFADELPTGSRKAWQSFLEALIAENVPLLLVGSTRAGDIVRDEDILHLYKKAGVIRFLLGIESYDEHTLKTIQKGGSSSDDQRAIQLLRQHGILSMATYVLGFQEEKIGDYWDSYRHLVRYDPDQVQLLYATPHRWTPFYATVAQRRVIQTDSRMWDYKHQVLAVPGIPAWQVFVCFKLIEVLVQLRPKVLVRMFFHQEVAYRHAMRWYTRVGRRVWVHEIIEFLFRTRFHKDKGEPTLHEFMGPSLAQYEYAHNRKRSNKTSQDQHVHRQESLRQPR